MTSSPRVRLIALDLDGTLLNAQKQISARNRRVLAAAAAAGVFVVPCSGRALDFIPPEVLTLSGVRYVISSAGGAAFDLSTDTQILNAPLSLPIVRDVLRMGHDAGFAAECYTGRSVFATSEAIRAALALVRNRDFSYLGRHPVDDLPAWAEQHAAETVKLNLMFADDLLRSRVMAELGSRGDILLTSASTINLEVNAAGHGKGDTLRHLGALLGVKPEEMLACGDQTNDLSMLDAVGFPVAMGNAAPEVLPHACWVAPTNEQDGVAAAVEKFVFAP